MKIETESGSHEFKDDSCVGKILHAKKEKGITIDDQAIAIALNECGQSKKQTKQSDALPFTLMGHWSGEKFLYELQVLDEGRVQTFPLKSPYNKKQLVTSMSEANSVPCPCKELGDIAGVSRLYGQFSAPIERSPEWMNFSGVVRKTKEVYKPIEQGTVTIKTENGTTEFNFNSNKISGRWLLREIPNIFDNGFIEGDKMQLFWKPDTKETLMSEKLKNIQLINPKTLTGEQTKINSLMNSGISIASNAKDFEVIVAAEGTWTDKFGQKFTYTKEFINTLFTNMNMQLLEGVIPIGVDKEHNKTDNGQMTSLQLLDQPISHIVGRGFYNGYIGDVNGASIDAELDAVFVDNFKSWFPVNGVTKRVSLVSSPACKVCYFVPKKQEG